MFFLYAYIYKVKFNLNLTFYKFYNDLQYLKPKKSQHIALCLDVSMYFFIYYIIPYWW